MHDYITKMSQNIDTQDLDELNTSAKFDAPEEMEEDFSPDPVSAQTIDNSWSEWKRNPSPTSMASTIKSMQPIIDKAVSNNSHASKELVRSEAKRLAIGAIKTYDPSQGTAVSTHVYNHLRPLRGFAERSTSVIDRTRTDNTLAKQYLEANSTLNQTLNRDPNDDELMDFLKVDAKNLTKMRRVAVGEMVEQEFSTHSNEADDGDPAIGMWADYVYSDLNPIDKKIFEMKTGRNGQPLMSSVEVANKLGVSEVYVNSKAAKISQRIVDGANSMANKNTSEIEDVEGEVTDG